MHIETHSMLDVGINILTCCWLPRANPHAFPSEMQYFVYFWSDPLGNVENPSMSNIASEDRTTAHVRIENSKLDSTLWST